MSKLKKASIILVYSVLGVSLEKGNAHIRPYFQNEKNYFLLAA
jgi:hypothetical protein